MAFKFTEEWYQSISLLRDNLARQLFQIRPTCRYGYTWYPCSVQMKNGDVIERVYFFNVDHLKNDLWIDDDRLFYSLDDVVEIKESPYRIPEVFWNKLANAGETAMGYLAFKLKFSDGTIFPYASDGYYLDFFEMPEGKTEADIVDAFPFNPRVEKQLGKFYKSAKYGFIYYRKE